jgi:NAD(P)-dependent dehydrogenase (short-subunit alcohol dehydrogenase family)
MRQRHAGRLVAGLTKTAALDFLCSDGARSITGITLPVDGGWIAH